MRWIWLPVLLTLATLLACGSDSGVTTAEELPGVYHQAMANEDWPEVWDLFSARAKGLCTFDFFIQSRDWFKEQSGDSYDFWLGKYTELSEGEWEADVSGDTAGLGLVGEDRTINAVLEDGSWHVDYSGEFETCLAFRP